MPWNENCVMDLKVSLIADWLSGELTKMMLSQKYNMSRPTVDKWLHRYAASGIEGLHEHSRRPTHSPNATPEWMQTRLIEVKRTHRYWGPKKVNDYLVATEPETPWPADSTTGLILKRAGLVTPKKRRRCTSVYPEHLTPSERPSQVWNVDFKGEAKLGNGRRCYPLTLSDDFSRYLLCCQGLDSTAGAPVRTCFEQVFTDYGVPEVIKSDNGTPFASTAIGGLSALSKWFIQLGIVPERIDKGKPTQNGRHERLHRTLKAQAMSPPRFSMKTQQAAFDRFRYEYNEQRSHEALNRQAPGTVFQPSPVAYQATPPPIDYSLDRVVRKVRHNGEIKWKGRLIYVGQVLAKEPIGLKAVDNERWAIYYSFLPIGFLNEKTMKVEPIKTRKSVNHVSG